MQTQNGGRPTILPKMYEEPLFSQIIDKIESGCNDREIYTSLHCSAKTFRKWRDDNIKAYDEAKSIARGNLLVLAESALASKLTVRTLKETETIYDADGNVEKVKVKEKELDKDSLVAMMVAKAGNPELYNPTEWRRLQQEESSAHDLKAKIEELLADKKGWKLDETDPSDLKVHPSEDAVGDEDLALPVKLSGLKYYVTVNVAVDKGI